MKNLFLLSIIVLLTLFIPLLNAQVHLGLQAGANLADVTMDPTQSGVETSIRTGFMFGGILIYSFSPMWGLQVEPAYVQKGAKVDQTETEDGMTLKLGRTLNADYLDIPILLKASFGDGPVKPYLLAGTTIAFLLGDANFEVDEITFNGMDVTSMIPSEDLAELEEVNVKSTDFILNFGGGVVVYNVFIEVQYNLGLVDVSDETPEPGEVDMTIKTTGFQIKAGVLFPL